MTLSIDLFWSFRSPYSYLATPRLVRLAAEYDLDVDVRPVLPLAVREPDFFDKVNPLWPPYLFRDTLRISQMEGIPYGWPQPDPVVQDMATRTISSEHSPARKAANLPSVRPGRLSAIRRYSDRASSSSAPYSHPPKNRTAIRGPVVP